MNRRHLAGVALATAALLPSRAQAQTDDAFCTYKASVTTLSTMLRWLFDELGRMTTGVTDAQTADPQWQVDVLAPYAVAQAAQHVLSQMDPPPAFATSHDLLSQSVDELVLAQAAMERGVLGGDLAAITEAGEHITASNALTQQATAALPD
jgi:hypothetical protein